jgi:hypothetical protein
MTEKFFVHSWHSVNIMRIRWGGSYCMWTHFYKRYTLLYLLKLSTVSIISKTQKIAYKYIIIISLTSIFKKWRGCHNINIPGSIMRNSGTWEKCAPLKMLPRMVFFWMVLLPVTHWPDFAVSSHMTSKSNLKMLPSF